MAPLLQLAEAAPDDALPADLPHLHRLSERQAQAILDLRLHRLTQLERSKITDELSELGETIRQLLHVLRLRARSRVLKEELVAVKERFATPRRTAIEEGGDYDIDIEDLIQQEDMVVTVTRLGYIKRTPLSTYRAQARGGKGRVGMATHEDDFLAQLFVANTHTPVLFFSSEGKVYKLKVYRLPLKRRRRAARRWSTCSAIWRLASRSPRCCRCPKTRTPMRTGAWCPPPPAARSGAMRSPTSFSCRRAARSR